MPSNQFSPAIIAAVVTSSDAGSDQRPFQLPCHETGAGRTGAVIKVESSRVRIQVRALTVWWTAPC